MSDTDSVWPVASNITKKSEFWRGVRASLPVLLGVIPLALVLGAQAAKKGFSAIELPLMTGLNFAGGSELAAIELWTHPPHILVIMMITFLINSRHILMGAAIEPHLRHLPKRKAFAALFFMTDESWAMGMADAAKRRQAGIVSSFSIPYYAGVSASLYIIWVLFTTSGVLLGPLMGDISQWGFDMAFPAIFLVLLRGMWRGFRAARPWMVSLIMAASTYYLIPGAWYVPVGALSGMMTALFFVGKKS
ncbi:AzlC family ABC transporter permease [Winslowiella iniecta]|uniref:Branched-chain amino acid ABC transporter permease n=3 Tax=Winslowiella iniecta TaxID=1560201 RepID=A0A0L7TGH9_9GAMM|nr:AzlC family ABC transporter permease [Winslowiella iniecta]KOC94462.1 branched-chain amino acid ABC transporter permease [Winslowiella iniecta]